MTADDAGGQTPAIDSEILDQLACPVCFGALRLAKKAVSCTGCGRAYPVIEGIPVLIADRALTEPENYGLQGRSRVNPGNAGS
jgi:uncharacterized protein YbaR (Trm112 family)